MFLRSSRFSVMWLRKPWGTIRNPGLTSSILLPPSFPSTSLFNTFGERNRTIPYSLFPPVSILETFHYIYRLNHQQLRIIAYGTLRDFGLRHPQIMPSINAWYKVARSHDVIWQKPQDVVKTFGASRVDILNNDRVCINLAGNQVRLIIKVEYGYGMAFVRWIGWHKDYDALGNTIHKI